jgi:hypothetical protein
VTSRCMPLTASSGPQIAVFHRTSLFPVKFKAETSSTISYLEGCSEIKK